MHNITFISTIHKELGKCNADELHQIIKKISPEVVFLEALHDTYSEYQAHNFKNFGVFHSKLEIAALQKYNSNKSFEYVPVLNSGLSESFEKKYNLTCLDSDNELEILMNKYNLLINEFGFKLLNSNDSIELEQELRNRESILINDSEVDQAAKKDIDAYEDSMMRNIYSYCMNYQFNTGIFMVGVAHRKSIIEKMKTFKTTDDVNINWRLLEI